MPVASPVLSALMSVFSVITPPKMWFPPGQDVTLNVKADQPVSLVITGFDGKPLTPSGATDVAPGTPVDVTKMYPDTAQPGTYLIVAVPRGQKAAAFVGTPIVEETLNNKEPGAPSGPMVTKLEPLEYAVIHTPAGDMTAGFYYDVAPNTVDSFLRLAREGYYDGLTFHRIVPGFVIQGGDPTGTGTGGPGYSVNAEFNDHPHTEGVLSMARAQDPNSAGSQFFVCLDYAQTKQLDNKYTAFGKVVEGMDAVKKIGATPADADSGKPNTPQVINSVAVMPVMPGHNPYDTIVPLDGTPAK